MTKCARRCVGPGAVRAAGRRTECWAGATGTGESCARPGREHRARVHAREGAAGRGRACWRARARPESGISPSCQRLERRRRVLAPCGRRACSSRLCRSVSAACVPRAVAIAARGAGSGARRRQRRAHNVARCVCGLGLGGGGGDAPWATQQARLDGAAGREPRAAISQSSALDATSAAWSKCNMGTGARAAWHWRARGGEAGLVARGTRGRRSNLQLPRADSSAVSNWARAAARGRAPWTRAWVQSWLRARASPRHWNSKLEPWTVAPCPGWLERHSY